MICKYNIKRPTKNIVNITKKKENQLRFEDDLGDDMTDELQAALARAAEYEKALERIACDCEKCWREEKDDCCHARAALHKEGPGPSSTACDDQFVPHWTERESMTKKPVQPQEAYMVADADGRIWYGAPEMDKDDAERVCSDANRHGIGRAPHRVIKVEITEVK
jgi:hypothetical protein